MKNILKQIKPYFKHLNKLKEVGKTCNAFIQTNPSAKVLRLNKPASLSLMLWPALWGFFSSDNSSILALPMAIVLIILLRIASYLYDDTVINDEEKTKDEPAGIPPMLALVCLSIAAFGIASGLGATVLLLVLIWMIMIAAYPYITQITWWPELFSGFIFGAWPVLLGQASGGDMNACSIPLMIAAFFWVSGIEILHSDYKRSFDLKRSFKSIATILGNNRITFISSCLIASLVFLFASGLTNNNGGLYYGFLMLAQAIMMQAYFGINENEDEVSRRTYNISAIAGLVIALGFMFS